MTKSAVKCETPRCVEAIEKWGAHYHSVHDNTNGTQLCERCGAIRKDGKWTKTCRICNKLVEELRGLFVPSRCIPCDTTLHERETKSGNYCSLCKQLRIDCCC